MKTLDDETLLGVLGAVLRVDTLPSAHEVEDLRELVISRDSPTVVVPLRAPRKPARMLRAAAVAAAVLIGAVGIGKVAGTSMPGSMRDPARAVGFPVDSQELTDARASVSQLRAALAQGNTHQVGTAADLLRARLRALAPDELHQIEPEADELLRQADVRLQVSMLDDGATATKTVETPATADTGPSGSSTTHAPPPATANTPSPSSATESDNKQPASDDKTAPSGSGTKADD